jgi:hypothetical protein
LSFGDVPATAPADAAAAGAWHAPAAGSKVLDAGKNEFRLRFSPQTWSDKIGSPEILSDRKILRPQSSQPEEGVRCTWSPEATNLLDRLLAEEPDAEVSYSMKAFDKSSRSVTSVVFDMKTHAGTALGTLRCFFPDTESAATVSFERWVSIVGDHLRLEIRP